MSHENPSACGGRDGRLRHSRVLRRDQGGIEGADGALQRGRSATKKSYKQKNMQIACWLAKRFKWTMPYDYEDDWQEDDEA